MADQKKPESPKPEAKPPKVRKPLTSSMAMRRVELMMEQLNPAQCRRLAIFAATVADERDTASAKTPTPGLITNVMHQQQPGV
jgi:hypothetical protein